ATNHLGHFALAVGLSSALRAACGARVVVVSSEGHLNSDVRFDDVNFVRHRYDPWIAYGQSKTACVLFAVEAARRWVGSHVAVNALHPGAIWEGNPKYKTVQQAAATSVLLASSPLVEGVTGKYFEDCAVADMNKLGARRRAASYALDPAKAARLWAVSLDMIASVHPRAPFLRH